MPKATDHDARRAELIDVAAELIAQRGMDGLTVRQVASAAGVSTGVVSHYFIDKRHLVRMTFDATADRVYHRVVDQMARAGDDVAAGLEGFLPLDAERARLWRVWLAFWGLAIGDEAFAFDQKRRARRACTLVQRRLERARRRGGLRKGVDTTLAAGLILGAIQGIAAQATFEPAAWSPARQRATLAAAVQPFALGRRRG